MMASRLDATSCGRISASLRRASASTRCPRARQPAVSGAGASPDRIIQSSADSSHSQGVSASGAPFGSVTVLGPVRAYEQRDELAPLDDAEPGGDPAEGLEQVAGDELA